MALTLICIYKFYRYLSQWFIDATVIRQMRYLLVMSLRYGMRCKVFLALHEYSRLSSNAHQLCKDLCQQ